MKKAMVLTAAAMLLFAPGSGPARADTESYWLAKYRAPVDQAVKKALAFMAKRLASDESLAREVRKLNAVAGLAGMAFLSAGHTPGQGPYGDEVNRCIDFILATPAQGPHGGAAKGWLGRGGQMYGHGIATLFLCEVSGMVDPKRQKKMDVLLPKALKVILTAQAVKKEARFAGGWRYKPDSPDSDLSISGWCLMALRSARLNGAPVPAEAIAKAIAFVNRCQSGNGFGYQPGVNPSSAMSAVGLLCRELSGQHNDAINRRCGDYLVHWAAYPGLLERSSSLFNGYHEYTTYYASQAMFQLGGKHWEQFAPRLYKHLVKHQDGDGKWRGHGPPPLRPPLFDVDVHAGPDRQLPTVADLSAMRKACRVRPSERRTCGERGLSHPTTPSERVFRAPLRAPRCIFRAHGCRRDLGHRRWATVLRIGRDPRTTRSQLAGSPPSLRRPTTRTVT